ncbi:MAG: hypothetical protein HC862_17700 [Scytonema sp. RU_4_4]|nr:hypothetical protein [Scytonema sp. RU_4_4]
MEWVFYGFEMVNPALQEGSQCGLGEPVRCGGSLRCSTWRVSPSKASGVFPHLATGVSAARPEVFPDSRKAWR